MSHSESIKERERNRGEREKDKEKRREKKKERGRGYIKNKAREYQGNIEIERAEQIERGRKREGEGISRIKRESIKEI